jgi:hypothetical protein
MADHAHAKRFAPEPSALPVPTYGRRLLRGAMALVRADPGVGLLSLSTRFESERAHLLPVRRIRSGPSEGSARGSTPRRQAIRP